MSNDARAIFAAHSGATYRIVQEGAVDFVSGISSLFVLKDRTLRCMDERTPGGIRLAGSGILMAGKHHAGIKKVIDLCKKAGVTNVTWHKNCGAAKLYLTVVMGVKNPTDKEVDTAAREFAELLADKLSVPCEEQEMTGVAWMHASYAVYYDGTGQLTLTNEMSAGFVVSRAYSDKTYAIGEVAVAVDIAFGDHGFGLSFTPELPFLLVATGKDQPRTNELIAELQGLADGLDENKRSRVKVVGFSIQDVA